MIVVIGAAGQLGTAFTSLLADARPVTRAELDIATATEGDVRRCVEGATAIVNTAAYTAVDRAEAEEELATMVNGHAVGRMAAVAADVGIPFVTFSTDYVFAGQGETPYLESDPTDPINAYGRSKLVGERLALEANPSTLLIRTSWVISPTHPNFVATMLRLVGEGRSLRVVDDQRGCPTVTTDLASATLAAIDAGATGILHLTNAGETTWFELARAAVRLAGLDPEMITACTTDEYPTPARRPSYSVLGSEVRPRLGLSDLPHWRDSLPAVVEGLLARS